MRQNPTGFLQCFAVIPVTIVTAGLIFNVLVDPLRRFDVVTVEGFNAQKTQFANATRLGKAGAVCRIQPGSIVMGTSRVELGVDPQHPAWDRALGPVYNLAMPGMGMHELVLTFMHAVHASRSLRVA